MPASLLTSNKNQACASRKPLALRANAKKIFAPTWCLPSIVILAAIIAIACLAAAMHKPAKSLFADFNMHLINMVSFSWGKVPADHRHLLQGHRVFLLSLLGFAALYPLLPMRFFGFLRSFKSQTLSYAIFSAILVFFCVSLFNKPLVAETSMMSVTVTVSLAALVFLRINKYAAIAIALLLILLSVYPGLVLQPDFSGLRSIDVLQMQQHYAVFLSNADKMALGMQAPKTLSLHYGVVLPLAVACFERYFGIINFATLVHLAQIGQAVFLSITFALMWKVSKGRLQSSLFMLLSVIPWFHCAQIGSQFPNHSGWRFLAVFIGLFILASMRKVPPQIRYAVAGAWGGFAILYNIETGISIIVAMALALYLYDTNRPLTEKIKGQIIFLGSLLITPLVYAGAYRLFIGTFPTFLNSEKLLNYLRAPEIITVENPIAPIACVMFVHASYVFVRNVMHARTLSYAAAVKSAVALILIVWQMYYFNRPYYSNLLSCWALYAILLLDGVRSIQIAFGKRVSQKRVFPMAALTGLCLATIVVPSILLSYHSSCKSYQDMVDRLFAKGKPSINQAVSISGVLIPPKEGVFLKKKSAYLAELAARNPNQLSYVTIYSLLVPKESRTEQKFHHVDPYFGVNFSSQFVRYLEELVAQNSKFVLLDNTSEDPILKGMDWHDAFLSDVRTYLANNGYDLKETANGWDVFEK